jgi:uncharacterized protein YjdB
MKPSVIFSSRNGLFAIVLSCLLATCACAGGGSGNGGGNPKLASIKVSAANANPIVGDTDQLTATGKFNDGSTQDLTSAVTWTTSPAGLATVGAGGVLTAQASGAVSVTASMGGVSGSANVTIAPKLVSIAITPASRTIAASTKQQFIATGTYSDNSTQPITGSVSWSSSNTGVATISDTIPTKGLALGVSAGTTNITATSGTITSPAAVLTVTSASATSLAISPDPASMALDVSQQFTATATFSDGTTQDVTNVSTWTSGSTSVATVTVSGLVTAKNLGTTNISAAFESVSGSSPLTVDASNLTSIEIQAANSKTSIAQGTKIQIIATGHFNNGSTNNLSGLVAWSSSDPTVASFSSVNVLSGVKAGNITITAQLGSITGTLAFAVSNATIKSVTLTPVKQTIPIGWHQTFTATGTFSDSSSQDISNSVTWSSDNKLVATVGLSSGVAAGVKQGTANISASFSYAGTSATGSTALIVSSATLKSIAVNPTSALLAPGSTLQINARGTWTDNTSQNISVFTSWSSSDTQIATVGVSGNTTGQSAGTATITATSGALSASAHLVVEGSNLVSIKITPQNLKLPATIETQLKATGTFSDGQQLDLTSAATWTSSAPSVATVSNASSNGGVATGVAIGGTTITAAFAGISATTNITVTNATLVSIDVTPSNSAINLGSSQIFAAQGSFTDGSSVNITVQVAWSSSDVTVATINSSGKASSASQGTTTIQASLNGVNGATTLTVQ